MFKSTKTYWQWTEHAERVSREKGIPNRKAGQPVMERHITTGEYGYRRTVPLSWVEKGYVVEAPQEQIKLF